MKNLLNRKLFELFELFDKKVRNYSLFDNFLNPYLNPSLPQTQKKLVGFSHYGHFRIITCFDHKMVSVSIFNNN
jgi:hypothetical protein